MKYLFQAILLSYFAAALANSNLSTKQAKNADTFYAGPNCKKIEDMFSEVKQQLAELKDEIREMKENQTWCPGTGCPGGKGM